MAFGPNLVGNGDFQTGTLPPWVQHATPETLEVVSYLGSLQAHVVESAAENSGFRQDYSSSPGEFIAVGFDYVVLSGGLRVEVLGGDAGTETLVLGVGSGHSGLSHTMGTGTYTVRFLAASQPSEFYIDNVQVRRSYVAIATNISLTVRDGKGALSNPSVHILSTTILDDIVEYAQEFATVMDAIMTGEVIAISATVRVALPGGLGAAAANSDVEEGAMFLVDCAGGVKSRLRVPTFDEAKMVAGSKLVDLTDADVINLVDHLEDGFTTTTPTGVDTLEYREADMEAVTAAYDAFQKSR